jgi:hypothetical protein
LLHFKHLLLLLLLLFSAASADHMGERKYHVQFFKLTSASPLSVRTRMRCLPHVQQRSSSSNSSMTGSSSGRGSSNIEQQHVSSIAAAAGTRCFLEVSVENTTALPLVLHAVRLLTPAGIAAQQLTLCEQQQQQQQQQQQWHKPQLGHKLSSSGMQDHNSSSSGNDTQLMHDIADAPSVHQHHQQQQQHKELLSGLEQLYLTQQQQQQQGRGLGPLLQSQIEPLIVVPPAGSHNYLWQVDHQHIPAKLAAAAAAAPAGSSDTAAPGTPTGSSSSSSVGRLELHWSNYEGKTGRLLTQPLSTLAAGWHRDVLMQLTRLQPAAAAVLQRDALHQAAAAASKKPQNQQQQQQQFAEFLVAGEPVVATFTLTAAAAQHQHATGPLLVLYSELPLASPNAAAAAAGAAASQQQPESTSLNSSLYRRQSGPSSSSGGSSSAVHPDVAVQGPRIQRLPRLQPGQSASVSFVLLPLRRGWVRLPNVMVVSESDGRLLDSVGEVQMLVV